MTISFSLKLLLPAIAFLSLGEARAQLLQGTIDGNVSDPTHAAVVGAKVTATDEQTNAVRETVTNSTGGYTLPTLPPGTYTVTVTSPGFQTYTQTGVVVSVNTVARVDVALKVGQVSESMTVAAQTAALQTDRADVRTDLTTQAPSNLPVPLGRNYQLLLPVLVPGVATPTRGGSFAANPSRPVQAVSNPVSASANNTPIAA